MTTLRRLDEHDLVHSQFGTSVWWLFRELVEDGAALGWVDPPDHDEIADLLDDLAAAIPDGDAAAAAATDGERLAAFGYWRRYDRPTRRPHADLERVAVAPQYRGRGLGRRLIVELVAAAMTGGVEVLTLDARADNEVALELYRSLGFVEHGRLPNFVAVGDRRWDSVLMSLDLR